MRKIYLVSLLLLLLIAAALPAGAESYSFPSVFMTLEVPSDPYFVQITANNIDAFGEYLSTIGETAESMRERFEKEGILLWAYDAAKERTFIITAVQDEQAKQYYDINEHTPETRATYRASHTNGVLYSKTDYSFESCEWKNFGDNQGRFLMLKYARKIDGKVAVRGLWRRTIRNGYTITLDMQVGSRSIAAGDITALNKIQDTLAFMQVSSAPDAPLTLGFTSPPPESTNSDTFTIKGVTRPAATVVVAFASMQTSQSKNYSVMADGKGTFSVDVTLPVKDLYNLLVSVTANEGLENEETISQSFSVEYDPSQLAVAFTSPFPEVFTTDSFKLTGTTLTGVTIQLVVNNELVTKKTGNNRTFSFTMDTSKEGDYDIQLTFSKKNYDTKVYTYRIRREMDEGQRRQALRDASIGPDYARLAKNAATYEGRALRFRGYVIDARDNAGEWVITFATQKNGDTFKNLIVVLGDTALQPDPDTQVTLYGTGAGVYSSLDESGKEQVLPRMTLAFIDQIEQ